MSQAIVQPADCCVPCESPLVQNVPGPQGDPGTEGTDGTNGSNAYTTTTAGFTMPAVSGSVTVAVLDSAWMAPGEIVFVQGAGYFTVNSLPDSTHVSLTNLGYTGNAAPATPIAGSQKVSPGGIKGADGASGIAGNLNAISPTNLKGDLLVDTGANNPTANVVRQAVGANGTTLHADSTQPTGQRWDKINLASAAEVTGVLPPANGGSNNCVAKAGDTMTGDLRVNLAGSRVWLQDPTAAADAKKWYFRNTGGTFSLFATDDAEAGSDNALSITRGGAIVNKLTVETVLSEFLFAVQFDGQVRFPQQVNTALVAGDNNNVSLGDAVQVKLKAGPVGAFALTGISNGVDGKLFILHNSTGQVMTLKHQAVASILTNRIISPTGADLVCNVAMLIFDIDDSRWRVLFHTA